MPSVVRLASQLFGRLPLRTLPADEAVALGAAVQVELKAGEGVVGDLVVTDVAPFSLGIASGTHASGAVVVGIFSPDLERGTVLPASRVERFSTMANDQREIKVEVYQGSTRSASRTRRSASTRSRASPRDQRVKKASTFASATT